MGEGDVGCGMWDIRAGEENEGDEERGGGWERKEGKAGRCFKT